MKQSKIINFFLGKEGKLISELLNKPEEWIMESYSPIVKINHISGLFIESNFLMEFKYPSVAGLNKTIKFNDFEYAVMSYRAEKLFKILHPESPKSKEDNFITYFENWKNSHD